MRLKTLAEGAISYSDNPATNMIIKEVGGLEEINQFAHSISNSSFKLKHYESYLNSNPKFEDDSSTPRDMGLSLENLLLGHILPDDKKDLLITWMRNKVMSKIFYKFQDNLIQGVAMPLVRKIVSKQAYLLNFATVLF